MESPLPTSQGHHNEEPYNTAGLQNVAEGHEGEQPQEKKSMLGRVKGRAKRIRDSLTNQSHSNDQDHPKDEDDKEMLLDPEVPGAPINDSASVTTPAPPTGVNSGFPAPAPAKGVNSGLPKGYLDTPKVMKEDHSESIISEPTHVSEDKHLQFSSGAHVPKVVDPIGNVGGREGNFTDPTGNENSTGPIGNVGGRGENLTDTIGNAKGGGENLGDGIRGSKGMEEDPHLSRKGGFEAFTPSNDQTKVCDPTGTGEEEEIAPILHSLDKMNISNEPEQKQNPSKALDPLTENPSNQSSYVQMFSSAAASAKNTVASSLGYGGTEPERHNEMLEGHSDSAKRHNEMQGREEATKPVGGGAVDNAQKITSPVAGAGSTVMSKVRGDDENKHASDNIESGVGPDKGVSDKLWPGDEDKELPEVISGAVHKRAPEDDGEERRPMGKVTESKAVAERLGTGSGEEGVRAGGEVPGGSPGAGKGMVGMIRGTVSSWLGKGSESPTSQGTKYDGNQGIASGEAAHEHVQHDVGGTRPRDSSN